MYLEQVDKPIFISRRSFVLWAAATGSSAWLGCSSADDPTVGIPFREPAELPPLESASLTTERTIVPAIDRLTDPEPRNPIVPADREALLADGFGDYDYGSGLPVLDRMPDDSAPPAPGAGARRLVRFIHTTDLHVTDDESPARFASFDEPDSLDSAARPQAAYMGRVLNAAVRTVNAVNRDETIDFVMLGGDSTDSALANEMGWLIGVLSGTTAVTCDSGAANDPQPGAANDPKDPFVPEGLDVPWRFCMGNHDTLVMGVSEITEYGQSVAMGNYCASGARDWAQPGGPVSSGDWIADEQRRPLQRAEGLELIASDGDGHGLHGRPQADKANYTFDVDGTDLRFVVHDTASETGGSEGLVRRSDLDSFLVPALDQAVTDGKWVVLVSHHPLVSISDGAMASDEAQAEAVLAAELEELFSSYDNVVLSLTGHRHRHAIRWVAGAGGGFWEVLTCSLVEFPQQMRLVEISDEDNGHLAITLVGVDYATDDDPVADEGRRLAVMDYTARWGNGSPGAEPDRNVKLYVPLST